MTDKDIQKSIDTLTRSFSLNDTFATSFVTWLDCIFFSLKHHVLQTGLQECQRRPLLALSAHIQWQRRTHRLVALGIKHLGTLHPHIGQELVMQNAHLAKTFRFAIVVLGRECVQVGVAQWRIRLAHFPSRPLV